MPALLALLLSATPVTAPLPLKSLVLYENGLGYFEREGRISPGGIAELPLEPGQLDDALKSLVVLSQKGVASVEYAPPLSSEAARALAGLPEREAQASLANLCRSLTGVEVEVRRIGGAPVTGRVLEVSEERGERVDKEGKPLAEEALLLFGAAGLMRVPLRAVEALRPSAAVGAAWSRAVGATAQQPERETLRVRGASGGGAVTVGYTTEAPVWRTTYRLVLGKKGARLQGFALVHNDSDERWDGVKVSLASGRPTSFLFPLAGPRYGRRELLAPSEALDTSPQLATREAREHLRGEGDWSGLGQRGSGSGGGGYGSGVGGLGQRGSGGGRPSGIDVGVGSVLLDEGPTPLEPAAVSEAGNLFLYTVKEPVTLEARKSALLPIIDGPAGAEPVTLLTADGQALLGVRLENTTGLTLEGGTLAVFTDGAYAGETQVDRIKPAEVRVVTHGEDLDLEVFRRSAHREGAPRKAVLVGVVGARALELTRVDRVVHTVDFTSRSAAPRLVLMQLDAGNHRVVSGATEDARSPGQPRYGRLSLAAKATGSVEVVEERAVRERLDAASLSTQRLDELLRTKPSEEVRALLGRLREALVRAEAAQAQVTRLDVRRAELEADVARTRENLGVVGRGGAADAARRLGQQLLALEASLTEVRRERERQVATEADIRRALLSGP